MLTDLSGDQISTEGEHSPPQVLVVTGMSGAGRSTAANILEDLGYLVVDNLPPELIPAVLTRHEITEHHGRLAVVVDVRIKSATTGIQTALDHLERSGTETLLLYLDADDEVIVRRYEENRRPHPLSDRSLSAAISAERDQLAPIRELADMVIDTTELNIHQLGERINSLFSHGAPARPMRVSVSSFGFKHGTPRDVDLLFDVRFLPNPHWVPELRAQGGTSSEVAEYVMSSTDAQSFLSQINQLLEFLVPRYRREGKSYLSIGVGCTGGRHRSVVLAQRIAAALENQEVGVVIEHRDLDRS